MSYDDIHTKYDISVHGGLTYNNIGSEMTWMDSMYGGWMNEDYWVVGFDTMHYLDDKSIWSKSRVLSETASLAEQLKKIK